MSDPVLAKQGPCSVPLKAARTYFWCACGRSRRQPFCDGSHAGTAFMPLKFSPNEDRDALLCACKRTANSPFCDCSPELNAAPTGLTEAANLTHSSDLTGSS